MSDDTPTDDSSTEYPNTILDVDDDRLFYCEGCNSLTEEVDIRPEDADGDECRHYNWLRVDDTDAVCTACYPHPHDIHDSAYGPVCGRCESGKDVVNLEPLPDPRDDDDLSPKEKAMEMQEDDDIIAVLYHRDVDTKNKLAEATAWSVLVTLALLAYARLTNDD